jgi:hypothetical protein
MVLAVLRDERDTALRRDGLHDCLTEIARILARDPRDLTGVRDGLGQQRLGLLHTIRRLGDVGSNNDLRRCIDGRLTVVPLDHSPLRPGIRHDSTLGIGEVALRLGMGARAGR